MIKNDYTAFSKPFSLQSEIKSANKLFGSSSEHKFELPMTNTKEKKDEIRSKTPNKQISNEFHKVNISEISQRNEPLQTKFYYRGKKKMENEKLLQEMITLDIKTLSNTKKLSENSYKLLIQKLEENLTIVLHEIDNNNLKTLSFEQIGRFLTLFEVFRVISYSDLFKLENKEKFFSKNVKDQERRQLEMMFHEQIWTILLNNPNENVINLELFYTVFRILLDPALLPNKELSEILENFLEKYFLKPYNEKIKIFKNDEFEIWSVLDIVKNFRKLTENRLAYLNTGFLKPKKFNEYKQKKTEEITFKPKLDPNSLILDNKQKEKFIENGLIMKTQSDIQEVDESKLSRSKSQSAISNKFDDRLRIMQKKTEMTEKALAEEREKRIYEKFKECTFTPRINEKSVQNDSLDLVDRLYDLKINQKKEELFKRNLQEKSEQELGQCTFIPKLNQTYVTEPDHKPNGFEKSVGRMRYAHEEYLQKKSCLEYIPKGDNYEKLINEDIKPFNFTKKKIRKPFIYIDVNIAPGKSGRIGLAEEDDPSEVAHNFAVSFQLNKEMEQSILQVLLKQKENHRNKIKKK